MAVPAHGKLNATNTHLPQRRDTAALTFRQANVIMPAGVACLPACEGALRRLPDRRMLERVESPKYDVNLDSSYSKSH